MNNQVINWFIANWIEIAGTLTGLVYIVLSVKQNIGLWFFGILNVALYIFVFYNAQLFADMCLQMLYLVMSVYGWWHWLYGKKAQNQKQISISRISLKLSIQLFLLSIVGLIVVWYILKNYTPSTIPFGDAFISVFSVTATWMLARKIIEHWLLWIVIDTISIGIYIYKGLYPTILLYTVFTILAAVGYFEWRKEL